MGGLLVAVGLKRKCEMGLFRVRQTSLFKVASAFSAQG